jgi:hypothetical protein
MTFRLQILLFSAGDASLVSTGTGLRGRGREQPCGQTNLCSRQRFRNGTVLLCLKRNRLEGLFQARNFSFHLKLNARYRTAIAYLVQLDIRDGVDAPWRDSFSRKLHGYGHRETARVRGSKQFLRVGCGLAFLNS